MLVLMMNLRHVGMGVLQHLVGMFMTVFPGDLSVVVMVVMPVIMAMSVLMDFLHVEMLVLMLLRDSEISSGQHDRQSNQALRLPLR
jgi:hypothetical protein